MARVLDLDQHPDAILPSNGNFLLRAEASYALRRMTTDGTTYRGRVDLVYLDPPFVAGDMFPALDERAACAAYARTMRACLTSISKLLSPQGSIWYHLPPSSTGLGRRLLAGVSERPAQVSEARWWRRAPWPYDCLLVLSSRPRSWHARLQRLWVDAETGDVFDAFSDLARVFGDAGCFAHPKPERLLRTIIELATEPGDLVLDPFAGSGTTAEAAARTGRRWIAIEADRDTFTNVTVSRMRMLDGVA